MSSPILTPRCFFLHPTIFSLIPRPPPLPRRLYLLFPLVFISSSVPPKLSLSICIRIYLSPYFSISAGKDVVRSFNYLKGSPKHWWLYAGLELVARLGWVAQVCRLSTPARRQPSKIHRPTASIATLAIFRYHRQSFICFFFFFFFKLVLLISSC